MSAITRGAMAEQHYGATSSMHPERSGRDGGVQIGCVIAD